MTSAEDARSIILKNVSPLETITLSLEKARGFVLAEDIIAGENIPPFDNAGMDGYAVIAQDTVTTPVQLRVINEIPAGSVSNQRLQRGEAMAIMTGAKIPEGCDAVVQIEWTGKRDDRSVTVMQPVVTGHNIRRAGNDIKVNSKVLQAGDLIRPQEIGVLASLGKRFVKIYRPPTVAILVTGNEIVEINKPVPDGKIRNSNMHMLNALVAELGCETVDLGIARDDEADLVKKITEGLRADVLITSGGVSVGKYDLVIQTMIKLGVEQKFWKVNIKPGMPFMFGMYGKVPVFGLPGNPVSTFVTFVQFVQPALLRMMGRNKINRFTVQARLMEQIRKEDGKRHFVRGVLREEKDEFIVQTTGVQPSNVLTSISKANCLIIIPEEQSTVNPGDIVQVELL